METILTRLIAATAEVILLLGAGYLVNHPTAVRDAVDVEVGETTPFSLARTQLLYWTVVILGAYLLVALVLGDWWDLNETCLIMLGISVSTTAGGRIIDARQNPFEAEDPPGTASRGFFSDLLSDERGVSVHRFQTVVFNVVFGLRFIAETVGAIASNRTHFPDFDAFTLGLVGVSSAAYLTLKTQEAPESGKPAAPGNVLADLPAG